MTKIVSEKTDYVAEKRKVHPVKVEGFNGTNEELGKRIFQMRYDKVIEVLLAGLRELIHQYNNDKAKKRIKLSTLLLFAIQEMIILIKIMKKIFALCKPFMKDELDANS